MIRYIGIILIGIGSVYGAYSAIRRNESKAEYIKAILDFVKYIRYCIVTLRKPLPEIYAEYDNDVIAELVSTVSQREWQGIKEDRQTAECLDGDTVNALCAFGSVLGRLPPEDEKRECDEIIAYLTEKANAARLALPKMCKIEASLFILGGIGLIITVI